MTVAIAFVERQIRHQLKKLGYNGHRNNNCLSVTNELVVVLLRY